MCTMRSEQFADNTNSMFAQQCSSAGQNCWWRTHWWPQFRTPISQKLEKVLRLHKVMKAPTQLKCPQLCILLLPLWLFKQETHAHEAWQWSMTMISPVSLPLSYLENELVSVAVILHLRQCRLWIALSRMRKLEWSKNVLDLTLMGQTSAQKEVGIIHALVSTGCIWPANDQLILKTAAKY